MSKIIDFSSMAGDVFIDEKIDKIKQTLGKPTISAKKLTTLRYELLELTQNLTQQALHIQTSMTQAVMMQFLVQQVELSTLIHECQNLCIDKTVDKLTRQAQTLAKQSKYCCKDLSKKVERLQKQFYTLTHEEALSLENRQMIHLAKKYLEPNSALDIKPPKILRLDFKKANAQKDLHDLFDLSIQLHEIAGYFYYHQFKEALEGFYSLPLSLQETIQSHFKEESIDLSTLKQPHEDLSLWTKHLYIAIQILLGYSHKLLYNHFECPTPVEIDELFLDLERTLKADSIANF